MSTNKPKAAASLQLSILDRLLDNDREVSREQPKTSRESLRELKAAVRRDLENLLNTRWRSAPRPDHLQHLKDSIIDYGLPDFTHAAAGIPQDPEVLTRMIRSAIEHFEPRLQQVRVERVSGAQPIDRNFQFRIEAVLVADPIRDFVQFNSTIEPGNGLFQVDGEEA